MSESSLSSPHTVGLSDDEVVEILLDMSQAALLTPTPGLDPEDEAALELAKHALESSKHSAECQAKCHVQIGICHWVSRRFAEVAVALETAKALGQDRVWTVQDDVMLWHSKRKVAMAAEKKQQEKGLELEKNEFDSSAQ